MASLEELRNERIKKLEILKEKGINPYPARVERSIALDDLAEQFEDLEKKGEKLSSVGRIMAIRGQGGIKFVVLKDDGVQFQVVFKKDSMDEELFELFSTTADIGDFVGVNGGLFVTKRGEKSLLVEGWTMVSKSLAPLPDKYHGLQDQDEIYRKRYLDILMNDDVREMFVKKSLFWKTIREFMERHGFMEVHTPTLETAAGGAEADPFITHHNDFDIDVFLRISIGELWQKRLMAAGITKTYEIGKAYRNEGSSPDHLQEFTNIEFYWSYADYQMGMDLVRDMYREVADKVFGKSVFEARGHTFDLSDEWVKIDYVDEIKRQTNINIWETSEEEINRYLADKGVQHTAKTFERLVDVLWKSCRKNLSGPAFVVNYPDFMQPLAKRNEENPKLVEQFQVLLGGAEIGKGYSELNDPHDQRMRFEHQLKLRESGDKEAMMPDYDFLEMLEHGMPPTCGFGAGDRLFAFLMNKPIREVQLFPLMKPKPE